MALNVQTAVTGALPQLVDTIEIRSAFSPPYQARVADLIAAATGPGPVNPYLRLVKPAVILQGGAIGTQVIAPAGAPEPDAWRTNLAVAGLVAVGGAVLFFGLGVAIGEWKARKR